MPMLALIGTGLLVAAAVGWLALETRLVHRALDHFGAEMQQWTRAMDAIGTQQQAPLLGLLDEADLYLTAYTTGFEPPGGQDRARQVHRKIVDALTDYRRAGSGRDHEEG